MDEYDDDDYEDMGSDEENDIIDDNEEFEVCCRYHQWV